MIRCELCKSNDFKVIATEIREGRGRILRCNSCKLIFQDAKPSDSKLNRYYNREYQTANSLTLGKRQSPRQRFEDKIKTLKDTLNTIRPLLKKDMSVLEVGCGSGELLYSIKPYVREVTGIELNREFASFMKTRLGIKTHTDDINKIRFDDKIFDLIICNATLDHLINPLQTLMTMKNLLSRRGRLYIEVPNADEALNYFLPSPSRERFNKFFWHKAHLFYFTKETIRLLFKKAGLKVKITCYHKYTLKNFLNWYFRGEPQRAFIEGATERSLFAGRSDFEKRMNKLFADMEEVFKKNMSRAFRGDTLCCTGWK